MTQAAAVGVALGGAARAIAGELALPQPTLLGLTLGLVTGTVAAIVMRPSFRRAGVRLEQDALVIHGGGLGPVRRVSLGRVKSVWTNVERAGPYQWANLHVELSDPPASFVIRMLELDAAEFAAQLAGFRAPPRIDQRLARKGRYQRAGALMGLTGISLVGLGALIHRDDPSGTFSLATVILMAVGGATVAAAFASASFGWR